MSRPPKKTVFQTFLSNNNLSIRNLLIRGGGGRGFFMRLGSVSMSLPMAALLTAGSLYGFSLWLYRPRNPNNPPNKSKGELNEQNSLALAFFVDVEDDSYVESARKELLDVLPESFNGQSLQWEVNTIELTDAEGEPLNNPLFTPSGECLSQRSILARAMEKGDTALIALLEERLQLQTDPSVPSQPSDPEDVAGKYIKNYVNAVDNKVAGDIMDDFAAELATARGVLVKKIARPNQSEMSSFLQVVKKAAANVALAAAKATAAGLQKRLSSPSLLETQSQNSLSKTLKEVSATAAQSVAQLGALHELTTNPELEPVLEDPEKLPFVTQALNTAAYTAATSVGDRVSEALANGTLEEGASLSLDDILAGIVAKSAASSTATVNALDHLRTSSSLYRANLSRWGRVVNDTDNAITTVMEISEDLYNPKTSEESRNRAAFSQVGESTSLLASQAVVTTFRELFPTVSFNDKPAIEDFIAKMELFSEFTPTFAPLLNLGGKAVREDELNNSVAVRANAIVLGIQGALEYIRDEMNKLTPGPGGVEPRAQFLSFLAGLAPVVANVAKVAAPIVGSLLAGGAQ